MFLDKVCIHQTDMEKKKRGIDGLGGFLRSSRYMLLLWDPTYFRRLWCTLEVAALTHLVDDGELNINVLPIKRGFTVMVGVFVVAVLSFAVLATFHDENQIFILLFLTVVILIVVSLMAQVTRSYTQESAFMRKQIESFKCDDAECFCCSVDHILPETGQPIDCDRQAIYIAIRAWFGDLRKFEHVVHRLHANIKQSMGPTLISFSDTLHLAVPSFWLHLSVLPHVLCPSYISAAMATAKLYLTFVEMPLFIGLLMRICWLTTRCDTRKTLGKFDFLVSILVAIVWTAGHLGIVQVGNLFSLMGIWPQVGFTTFMLLLAYILLLGGRWLPALCKKKPTRRMGPTPTDFGAFGANASLSKDFKDQASVDSRLAPIPSGDTRFTCIKEEVMQLSGTKAVDTDAVKIEDFGDAEELPIDDDRGATVHIPLSSVARGPGYTMRAPDYAVTSHAQMTPLIVGRQSMGSKSWFSCACCEVQQSQLQGIESAPVR